MNSLPDSRKYRVMLLGAVLCVAMATACRLDVFIGAEGNSGAGSVSGSSAAGPATNGNGGNLGPGDQPAKDDGGIDDSASLPAVKSVLALSVSAAADYASSGQVSIDLLATDATGKPILEPGLAITAEALNDGSTTAIPLTIQAPVFHSGASLVLPWAVVLDLDSSGSMTTTDPGRLRVSAAKAFAATLLASRPGSQIAIADFGAGSTVGFNNTRWLCDFSSSLSALETAIEGITASGATPLYESVDELLVKLHESKPASDFQPMLFVFSDGAPTSTTNKATALDHAQTWGIPVHAISLGDASVKATMSELADQTGGIHADAADTSSLQATFNALVVAKDKGYATVILSYPAGSRAQGASVIRLTVRSGGQSVTSTINLVL